MYKQDYAPIRAVDLSDNTLIEQTLAGNDQAFENLVFRYQTALYNFIGRCLKDYELAWDVLQFVFLQLHISLPKLQFNLSTARTKAPLKSWLFQVAWNRCMDELRKQRPLLFSDLEFSEDDDELNFINIIQDQEPLPEEIAERNDLHSTLCQAIQTLPPKFRSVVFLRYTRELSFVEIGRALNMPENTAKTYFQRARPLLRIALAPHLKEIAAS